jgi:hypothetical protein
MSIWSYSQASGVLISPDGEVVGAGYSGAHPYVNKPRAEWREDEGPIPTGNYTIGAAVDHATCGPCSLPLEPDPGNEMHGRSAFLIHGDTATMDQTASTGCIILPRNVRDLIEASDCRELIVTV